MEDAAAPVVWRTCAFGRGVSERARRPREESGPGATTPTVVGGGLDGPKGSHHFLFGVYKGGSSFLWAFVCVFVAPVRQVEPG